MMTQLRDNLLRLGYQVSCFGTKEEASAYLNTEIDATTVGFGGSVTLGEMGLYDSLGAHNTVWSHHVATTREESLYIQRQARDADVYLSSVNGIGVGGEIVNIDGNCNRVASILWGHRKVYLIVGVNKITPDLESAVHRARHVAAPKNAQRLHKNTPCAQKGDRCYDCQSPERICRGVSILLTKPSAASYEVILIDEVLGY